MQKHVNLVDPVKSFPTNIFLQNLASIQKRTSPIKFAHLTEKSEKGSISNLSTKLCAAAASAPDRLSPAEQQREAWTRVAEEALVVQVEEGNVVAVSRERGDG